MVNLVPTSTNSLTAPWTSSSREADPSMVQRFEDSLRAPPSSPGLTPVAAPLRQQSLQAPSADSPLATDDELARLPESELARIREQWGEDDAGLRSDAKMLLQLRQNMIEAAVLKSIKRACKKASIV